MSRKMLIAALVMSAILASLVAPAAAMPIEPGAAGLSPVVVWSGDSSSSLVRPLPLQLTGDGDCGGAGSCPT